MPRSSLRSRAFQRCCRGSRQRIRRLISSDVVRWKNHAKSSFFPRGPRRVCSSIGRNGEGPIATARFRRSLQNRGRKDCDRSGTSRSAKAIRLLSLPANRVYQFAELQDNEVVAAYDLDSGKLVWKQTYAAPYQMNPAATAHGKGPKSTPVVAGNRLYTQLESAAF